jgi:MinD-like ATPase involved in chromosome partitioning or flagellar assembly
VSSGVLVAVGAVPFEPAVLSVAAHPGLHVVRRCVDLPDLMATAARRQAQAALVSAALRGLDVEAVERLRGEGVAVVGVVAEDSSADEALLRQIGIDYVVAAGDAASLAEVIVEAVRLPTPAAAETPAAVDDAACGSDHDALRRGRVVAVWGPAGSPGRSTVALGLSAEVAALGVSTLLVDADVYGGAIAQMLAMLDESSGLLAAARSANAGTLTRESLARHARSVSPRLRVLSGLPRADRWPEVQAVLVRHVIEVARTLSAVTVVDCGFNLELDEEISYDTSAPRRNGATWEVLERADVVLVVGGADPVSLSRLIRGVGELKTVLPSVSPSILVNRVRGGLGWTDEEVIATLVRATGLTAIRLLPDDPAATDRALVRGGTLTEVAPDSKLTRAFGSLASQVAGVRAPDRPTRTLLGRWR